SPAEVMNSSAVTKGVSGETEDFGKGCDVHICGLNRRAIAAKSIEASGSDGEKVGLVELQYDGGLLDLVFQYLQRGGEGCLDEDLRHRATLHAGGPRNGLGADNGVHQDEALVFNRAADDLLNGSIPSLHAFVASEGGRIEADEDGIPCI